MQIIIGFTFLSELFCGYHRSSESRQRIRAVSIPKEYVPFFLIYLVTFPSIMRISSIWRLSNFVMGKVTQIWSSSLSTPFPLISSKQPCIFVGKDLNLSDWADEYLYRVFTNYCTNIKRYAKISGDHVGYSNERFNASFLMPSLHQISPAKDFPIELMGNGKIKIEHQKLDYIKG